MDRILQALEKRDVAAARDAMRRHIQATIDFRKHREGLAKPVGVRDADDRASRRVARARS